MGSDCIEVGFMELVFVRSGVMGFGKTDVMAFVIFKMSSAT